MSEQMKMRKQGNKYQPADEESAGKDYENYHNSRAASLRPFKNFYWDRQTTLMTEFSDLDYFSIMNIYLNAYEVDSDVGWAMLVSDNGEGDGQGYFEKGIQEGFQGGSQKDIDSTNEEYYIKYSATWFQMLMDIIPQHFIRSMCSNLATSDTARSGTYGPFIFTRNSWEAMIHDLAEMSKVLPIPKFVMDIVTLLQMYIQRTERYQKGSTYVPASYLYPWSNRLTLAKIYSNSDSLFRKLQGYAGLARIYMEKFNIPTVEFSTGLIAKLPRKVNRYNNDWLAFMSHIVVPVYGSAIYYATCSGNMTGNMTTSYTSRRYFFRLEENMSWIHRLAKLFSWWNATNNVVGISEGNNGVFRLVSPAAANYYGICRVNYLGTAFARVPWGSGGMLATNIQNEIPCLFKGDSTNYVAQVKLTGGTGTPLECDELNHPLFSYPGVMYGENIGFSENRILCEDFFTSAVMGGVTPASSSKGGKIGNKRNGRRT